jgi:hypothetical protein
LMQHRYYRPRGTSTCAFLLTSATKVPAVPQKSLCPLHAASTPVEAYPELWIPDKLYNTQGLIECFPQHLTT